MAPLPVVPSPSSNSPSSPPPITPPPPLHTLPPGTSPDLSLICRCQGNKTQQPMAPAMINGRRANIVFSGTRCNGIGAGPTPPDRRRRGIWSRGWGMGWSGLVPSSASARSIYQKGMSRETNTETQTRLGQSCRDALKV